jgi:hypothetical protein
MSKQDEAGLILKLYELRREETMRKARNWFFLDFNPESIDDVEDVMFSENSNLLRMFLTYWDMAAGLVNHGAIGQELFNDVNAEHYPAFAKLEPFIEEARTRFGPQFLKNLEHLIDATPHGRERTAQVRERIKAIRERVAQRRARTAQAEA